MIDLFLFENDAPRATRSLTHGIRHFLADWEISDKAERQKDFDTEIAPVTVDDLRALAAVKGAATWCRINRHGPYTARDIDEAVAAGADGIFLPMVTAPAEVEDFLRQVNGRCATGILVETLEACAMARDLAKFPLERVYFGLNDFAISRGGGSIFRAVLDGSVERMREVFSGQTFGFGGMTAVEAGDPLSARMLLQEMARLRCQYTFLRRSFRRDTRERDPGEVVAGIQAAWLRCRQRDAGAIRRDRQALESRLHELCR